MPAYADTLVLLPHSYTRSNSVDHTGDFMTGYTRQLHALQSEPCDIIAATHTTSRHFYPYVTGTGIGHWKTRQHEGAACLHCLHGSHGRFTHIVLLGFNVILSCSIAH
jgi:hypothetical protein